MKYLLILCNSNCCRAVDSNPISGAVTVPEDVEYEIEATGRVTLAGGFTVEKGAYFAIRPASYK